MRFTRSEGGMELELRWIPWIWRGRKELRSNQLPPTVHGRTIRSWNSAASENSLWKRKCSIFFGDSFIKQIGTPNDIVWKDVFQEKYSVELSAGGPTNRAACRICGSTVWLSGLTRRENHNCTNFGVMPRLELISARKVAKYVMGDELWGEYFTDTDDDLDDTLCSPYQLQKLWAYPKFHEVY